MPKGGKKKTQKSEAPKEEPPPAPPEPMEVVEEEGIGLGLGGSKRKAKKEKKQQQELARQAVLTSTKHTPLSSREQSEAPEEPPQPKVETEPRTVEEVAEEVEGLGIGGARKRKPKKKKSEAPPAEPCPPPQVVPAPQVATTTQVATTPPAAATPQVATTPKVAATPQAAPTTQVAATPQAVATPQVVTSPRAVTTPPEEHTPGPSRTLLQMSSSSPLPPPGFTSPPVSAWGRGRGRALSQSQGPASSASAPPGDYSRPPAATHSTPHVGQSPPQSTPRSYSTQHSSSQSSYSTQYSTSQSSYSSTERSAPRRSQYSQENVMCRYKIPNKVPGGTVGGRRIPIVTNYLQMTFKPLNISRYDVSFTPDRPKKLIPEVFKKVKAKFYPNELLAFDQTKNCYSLRPLANVPPNERFNTSVEIEDNNGRVIKFEVSLKATGVVELAKIKRYMAERGSSVLHPTEEVQCIDVILRQGTLESYVKAGRQFFRRPANPIDLGLGYEMWTGLFQSAIFTNKAFINIDVAHKGFPKCQPLINALINDFKLNPNKSLEKQLNDSDAPLFINFVRGLRVIATLVGDCPSSGQKREYVCNGVVAPPAILTFTLNDPAGGKGREISVGEYFAREKKYQIRYPFLNCVWVGPRDKSIYFPIELLDIAYGQPLARQLNDVQISKMVREAATPPDQRLRKINEVISSMKYSTNPDFKRFGLEISDRFYEVDAKILEPPVLDIGHGIAVPRKGVWQATQLLKPEALQAWGFLALDTSPQNDYENVISMLMNTGRALGMAVAAPLYKKFDGHMGSLSALLHGATERGCKFLFVVVSMRGRDHYHRVKQMAEREIGVLTQCVKEATARRMNTMTAKNILLKVNSKLMGINQALGDKTMPRCLRDGGVMIVGADVTHPSPEQSNVPSIAAVTASIDPKYFMYNIELSVQTPKKEMIVEFEDMIYDHLKVYRERNHKLPRKIFVFRDGVSEGQFVQVMNSELAAVHAAYSRLAGADKKPEILFLLVQKRHHTRFFNTGRSAAFNVEPGTVVDTDIVHSSELDFYLVSHQAIKGTARPTRYHAVCNDGKIPDDEVEQLTYYLCHLYSRCMRSVSYPTPTYYAHLACLRARTLTFDHKFNNKDLEKSPHRLRVLDKMLQYSRMFFV